LILTGKRNSNSQNDNLILRENSLFCGYNINTLHLFLYIPQGSGADETEADIVVPVVGIVVVPIR